MRRLSLAGRRGSRRRRCDDDSGAVSAIVAVLLSAGVLLGMGALVIDVGQLYGEREQLQSGADAASWRVAEACVLTPASCTNTLQAGNAQTYAARNAKDGAADAQVCVNGVGCPGWNTAVTCPALPANPGSYAEVRTSTLTADGSTLVPPALGGAIAGTSYHGKRVGACARVSWGTPAGMQVLALGISLCDWKRMTANGTAYFGVPGVSTVLDQAGAFPVLGLTSATSTSEGPIVANVPLGGSLTTCTTPPNLSVPRGYAWLGSPDSSCKITITAPVTVASVVPVGATAAACAGALSALRTNHRPVLVPIFDLVTGVTTVLGNYRVVGFAAFQVTGYTGLLSGLGATLSNLSAGVPALASTLCGLANCIYGYFTKIITPKARPAFTATANYGVSVIGRTG